MCMHNNEDSSMYYNSKQSNGINYSVERLPYSNMNTIERGYD